MGFLSGVGKALGIGTGFKSNDPKLQSYDMDTAMKSGNVGVISDLGNIGLQKNADGTWSRTFTSSANDTQRNNLMSSILSGMGDSSGADEWYNNSAKRLNTEFDKQRSNLDESLVNRGIAVGDKQYNDAMGELADKQNQSLADLSSNATMMGQQYDANRINQANALSEGRDIGLLAGMGLQNNNYSDYISQDNNKRMATSGARAQQAQNLFNTGAAIASLF